MNNNNNKIIFTINRQNSHSLFLWDYNMAILRPHIPLSTDGEPLTVSSSDLYGIGGTFPYERLPSDSPIVAFFMKPFTPILLISGYIITEKFIAPKICRSLSIEGKSFLWKCLFTLHNFTLAIFSLVVYVNSWVSDIK